MGVEHELLDISFLSKVAWYSALTNPDRFPVPSDRSPEQIGHGIPITYVPMRNTIFLSVASAYLESRVLHAVAIEGADPSSVTASVYMAPNALDMQLLATSFTTYGCKVFRCVTRPGPYLLSSHSSLGLKLCSVRVTVAGSVSANRSATNTTTDAA